MARQHTQAVKSIAGSALLGPGLLILVGNLDVVAAQLKSLLITPGEGLGLLSSVILAASLNHQRLLQSLLHMLVSFWPLLFVMVGAALLRDVLSDRIENRGPHSTGTSKKKYEVVDLKVSRSTSN